MKIHLLFSIIALLFVQQIQGTIEYYQSRCFSTGCGEFDNQWWIDNFRMRQLTVQQMLMGHLQMERLHV